MKPKLPKKAEAFLASNWASIEAAVEAKDYEALATAGAELGLWFMKGQEYKEEPGFMPMVQVFKKGTPGMIGALADGGTFTKYTFPDGVLKEEYIVLDGSKDNSFVSDLLTREAADVVMTLGSAWSKGPDVKTMAQVEKSSRHSHVVAFANIYVGDAKSPVASKALLFQQAISQAA